MILSIDHIVLTVKDINKTILFYRDLLGMTLHSFYQEGATEKRYSLNFGNQKINLHQSDSPYNTHAGKPLPGTAGICFLSSLSLAKWKSIFIKNDIIVEEGPVQRTGTTGNILSLYVRDPDMNLIEISNNNLWEFSTFPVVGGKQTFYLVVDLLK